MSKKKDSFKPWLSRPAINRSVTIPFTTSLTHRLSSLGEFHPNELDPFLLFDARDSMIGTLENPTLDLDPSKPDTLNVITATRAGTATFTDVNGNIASASPNNVRVDYSLGYPAILVEPSSENLVTYSEDFSKSSYEKTRVAITTDDAISPDGNTSADKLSATATTGTHFLKIDRTVTNGAAHTFSVFVKKGEYDWVNVMLQGTGWTNSTKSINFNASTGEFGTVTSGVTHTSESLANGWYRLSITNTTASTTVAMRLYAMPADNTLSYQGDGTSGVYLWGAQLEESSVATSYIPTSGGDAAARTRGFEDLVISGSAFSSFYNASEGTVYVESVLSSGSQEPFLVQISQDNGDSNRMLLWNDANNVNALVDTSGTRVVSQALGSRPAAGALSRAAFSYATNNIKASVDGGSVATDTSAALPTGINKIFLSSRVGQSEIYKLNGHIKRLIYWPYHSDSL